MSYLKIRVVSTVKADFVQLALKIDQEFSMCIRREVSDLKPIVESKSEGVYWDLREEPWAVSC